MNENNAEMTNSHASRLTTKAIFLITGMAMGLWATLVPYAQQRTGSAAGELGLLLLCLGAGSLLSMIGSGRLLGRFGCRSVIVGSVLLYSLMLPLLATLDDLGLLALSLFIFGMGIGLADVAMNVQGSLVEQAANKPLMSGFHCMWSVGGIAGAAGGALMLSTGLTPLQSTWVTTSLIFVILLLSLSALLPFGNNESTDHSAGKIRPNFRLIMMAIMAMISFMAEGAVIDWSGIFMTDNRGMTVAHAGWGFAVFASTMSLMRLTGDAVVTRMGRKRILICGGLAGLAGYLMVVMLPGWQLSLCGFALIGIGAANIVPVLITLAGQETVMPVNMSVSMVATLGYLGVLGGPALLGWIAHISSLYVAFTLVAAAFLIVVWGAFKLRY